METCDLQVYILIIGLSYFCNVVMSSETKQCCSPSLNVDLDLPRSICANVCIVRLYLPESLCRKSRTLVDCYFLFPEQKLEVNVHTLKDSRYIFF